ncbi:MAG: hypothetical protein LH609_07600, partial [Rudanella sp.]|nr:hypothetical protein [Rudanella sp.]
MKTTTINFRPLVFSFLIISVLAFMASCAKKTEQSASSESGLPSLFARKGELANAIEWPKTQQKVEELKMQIAKEPNNVKPRLQLVTIYLSEARITGEHPYYYPAILK